MSRILFDERPLVVPVKTATKLGLEEAIILQQVHYWLQDKEKNNDSKSYHDGRYWVFNSYEEWKNTFPFWSVSTIRRKIGSLEESGFLISSNYNELGTDRTKWYTINYEALDEYTSDEQMDISTMDKSSCSDRTNPSVQNEQMEMPNLNRPLPKTTSETTPEIPPIPPKGHKEPKKTDSELMDRFEVFYSAYPRHKSRGDAEKAWRSIKPSETLFAKIMQSLEVAKKDPNWQKENHQYVPYPASWLRAKGWEDEHSTDSSASESSTDKKKGWGGYLC